MNAPFGPDPPSPTVPGQKEWANSKRYVSLPNGIRMAYLDIGNPRGKPLLLVHGYTDTSRAWSNLAPYLTERRILAVDLRGHGASSAPRSGYGIDELANDVSMFISAMRCAKVDLAGHSLGTMVSQALAARHPGQVDRLILLAGSAGSVWPRGGWLWQSVMALEDPIDPHGKFMDEWYDRTKPLDPPDMDGYARVESARIPADIWQAVLKSNEALDLSATAGTIVAPTLIVAGGKDILMDGPIQERLREAIRHAEFHAIAEAGHGLFKEYPERVALLIGGFLER